MSATEVDSFDLVERGRFAGMPFVNVPSGPPAVDAWRHLRGATFGQRYPVILDGVEDVDPPSSGWRVAFGVPDRAVTAALAMGPHCAWVEAQSKWIDRLRPFGSDEPPRSAVTVDVARWPDRPVPGRHQFAGPAHVGWWPQPTVDVLLLPCSEPWMAPAHLQAEPHNDKPDAAVQCAAYRDWQARFAAEMVYTNGVICEFAVGLPPTNTVAALALAVEHYLFCPDRLNQRCPDDDMTPPFPGTLEAYAAALMNSSVWYFWWD